MKERIELIKDDITRIEADAIVNAANTTLLGGGGVDGSIHRAAGPGLLAECRQLNGCPTGQARLTGGYRLKAKYIIHTVGPVWSGGHSYEHDLLASCYRSSLTIAADKKIRSVAFPCISTGVYGFPKDEAAVIAVNEARRFLRENSHPAMIIFVTFDDESFRIYSELLKDE